jgi:hypothetical protein
MAKTAIVTLLSELATRLHGIIGPVLHPRGIGFILVLVDPESDHNVVRANIDGRSVDAVLRNVHSKMAEARVTLPDG